MQEGDPSPAEIRAYEVTLAGVYFHCNKEAGNADIAFKKAIYRSTATSAAGRKQEAEAGLDYEVLVEAERTLESCHQMLMTCRNYGRSVTEEMKLTK